MKEKVRKPLPIKLWGLKQSSLLPHKPSLGTLIADAISLSQSPSMSYQGYDSKLHLLLLTSKHQYAHLHVCNSPHSDCAADQASQIINQGGGP